MKGMRSVLAMVVSGLALAGATVNAQPVGERVIAVVNDDPISTFDVRQRMRLMMITQGIGELPPEAIPQFQDQAMRDLIEERLKLQEAARWDLEIPSEAIDEEIMNIAASGGSGPEQLARDLAAQGVDIGTLREKIRADQAWEQLVQGRFGSRVNVTDDEIANMMDDLRASVTEDQYLLSEICLPVSSPSEQQQMYNIGMQMIEQMRQGAPFRALAQQYSACPSAARGGDLGWMRTSELDPDIANVVSRLGDGNVTRPIPQQGLLKLFAVCQTRSATQAGEPGYMVSYAGAPTTLDEDVAKAGLNRLLETNACNGENLSTDLGQGIGVTSLPMLKESEFESVFHDELARLEEGDVSEIIESEGAWHRFILCEKDEGYGLPSRRMVESRLRSDELDLLSRRYLRDVERDSAIELRMDEDESGS